MIKNAPKLTNKPGRSELLSHYVREARQRGSETVVAELAAQYGVEAETIREALNRATMGR